MKNNDGEIVGLRWWSVQSLDLSLENHYSFLVHPLRLRGPTSHTRGDRMRSKMRKIIGRSDLIMATPVKNKLLIGIRTIW